MKRKVIYIDEKKCNGCGQCISGCPEGALQIIDGKARLISDILCDGLGACVKECPIGAMRVEEKDAEPYNEAKAMQNIVAGGQNVIKAHLQHLKEHGQDEYFFQALEFLKKNQIAIPSLDAAPLPCGCPGKMSMDLRKDPHHSKSLSPNDSHQQSELANWPIQLKLLNPNAPYLQNADLLIAADCTAFAYPNFHAKFLKNKVLIMLCPKLDNDLEAYINKLANIFTNQNIKSITIVHMEVPCCGGVDVIVSEALKKANKNIIIKDYTVSLNGSLI